MSKKANQKGAERNIVSVPLADIQPSAYNPRKNFDQSGLEELAESIRHQGVLQPIGVRPLAESGKYEIIFGERRYRASLIAGLESVPSVIFDVSEAEAEDMAVTENLQRKDVTPMEEADAYRRLIDTGRHDVQSLAVHFGKSENYIRTRLKFSALIPEIAELLDNDDLTISAASEICRYGEEVQKDLYENHLKESRYNNWRGLKASDLAANIERCYTSDLSRYEFDKAACLACPHNTLNMDLFCGDGCGNCTNRTCLESKKTAHLAGNTLALLGKYPESILCHQEYNYNKSLVEHLKSMGYDVMCMRDYPTACPEMPEAPEEEEYDSAEEYEEALEEYREDMIDYEDKCDQLRELIEAGGVTLYVRIGYDKASLCYMKNAPSVGEDDLLGKLERQDVRNREIADEKTLEAVKKQIVNIEMPDTELDEDEEKMVYYFLLPALRKEHFKDVGLDKKAGCGYLSSEDKMTVVANLTSEVKAIILRDFLLSKFADAYARDVTAVLLLEFAQKHMASDLAEIRQKHDEVYMKRHMSIEKRKAALLSKKQKEEQPEKVAAA